MMSPLRIHKLINELSEGNEDLFAKGLLQELEIRKQEICKNLSIKIFESIVKEPVDKTIDVNDDIKQLIETITQTEVKKNIKMQFKNASILNISENDIKPIKMLFDQLNQDNQKLMAKNLFENQQQFKQTLEFAKKVKGLTK
jgi:membrane-bound lytic murein transglycosylase MltF